MTTSAGLISFLKVGSRYRPAAVVWTMKVSPLFIVAVTLAPAMGAPLPSFTKPKKTRPSSGCSSPPPISPPATAGTQANASAAAAIRAAPLIAGSTRSADRSIRERIRPDLELVNLRAVRRAAFVVEHGARARSCPEGLALPARVRIVDTPVDQLGEEAQRVRHAEIHDLAVDDRHQRLAAVRHRDRHVVAEAERVVAIDPQVIRVVRNARGVDALELRPGHLVDGPALGTELAFGSVRPVERSLALAAIEARDVPARIGQPRHAVRGHVDAARAPDTLRRNVHLGERGLGGIRPRHGPDEKAGLVHAREADAHRLAPDRVVHRARHDAVVAGGEALVLRRIDRVVRSDELAALAVAVGVDHDRHPGLRL